jgi:hypothetical protein
LVPVYEFREHLIIITLSLPRRRETSDVKGFWIPVFTGMTFLEVALRMRAKVKVRVEVE